jgi:hypothetical protein
MNDFSILKQHHDRQRALEHEAVNERLVREAQAYNRKSSGATATQRVVIPYRLILAWVGRRLIVVGARLHTRYGEVRDSAVLTAALDLYRQEQQEQSL